VTSVERTSAHKRWATSTRAAPPATAPPTLSSRVSSRRSPLLGALQLLPLRPATTCVCLSVHHTCRRHRPSASLARRNACAPCPASRFSRRCGARSPQRSCPALTVIPASHPPQGPTSCGATWRAARAPTRAPRRAPAIATRPPPQRSARNRRPPRKVHRSGSQTSRSTRPTTVRTTAMALRARWPLPAPPRRAAASPASTVTSQTRARCPAAVAAAAAAAAAAAGSARRLRAPRARSARGAPLPLPATRPLQITSRPRCARRLPLPAAPRRTQRAGADCVDVLLMHRSSPTRPPSCTRTQLASRRWRRLSTVEPRCPPPAVARQHPRCHHPARYRSQTARAASFAICATQLLSISHRHRRRRACLPAGLAGWLCAGKARVLTQAPAQSRCEHG
jgi:hypothetical protein